MAGHVGFSVSAPRIGATLELSYRVFNSGSSTLYLTDLLERFDRDAGFVIDPALVYVAASAAGKVLLGRLIVSVPANRQVVRREVPIMRRLPPGGELTGSIAVGLPLAWRWPYLSAPPVAARRRQEMELAIGYLDEADFPPGQTIVAAAPGLPPGTGRAEFFPAIDLQKRLVSQIALPADGIATLF